MNFGFKKSGSSPLFQLYNKSIVGEKKGKRYWEKVWTKQNFKNCFFPPRESLTCQTTADKKKKVL